MVRETGVRQFVFKNRGALLVPVALVLVIFGRPSIVSACVGIGLAALGEAIRIWAVGYSGVTTRAEVVTAPQLVTAGPYAVVRNPLYVGNSVIALGFWIAFAGRVSASTTVFLLAVVLVLVIGVYSIIVPLEESYLAATFGDAYSGYRAIVPRVIPNGRVFPRPDRRGEVNQ